MPPERHLGRVLPALACLGVLWAAPSVGLAQAPDEPPAARALRDDLAKIVELREQRGWGIDAFEIEAMLPDALLSFCAVPPAARTRAGEQFEREFAETRARIGAREGLRGDDLRAHPEVLAASRRLGLFAASAARSDDCPFTIRPSEDFRGRQFDRDTVTLNAEGGGLASFGSRGDGLRFGGGGAGRLSVGFGLGERYNLRVGFELGGAALLNENIRADDVSVDFLFAAPVALRRNWGPYVGDLELAPIALGNPLVSAPMRYGVRFAVLGGVSALRVRDFLPWTGLVLMGEWVAPRGPEAAIWSIRAGVRIGFAWRL